MTTNNSATTGFKDYHKFISDLQEAINDEASAIAFYEKLLKLAQNERQHNWIELIRDDEKKHLHMLSTLYRHLTGKDSKVQPKETKFRDFKAGIGKALDNELEAAEFYRNLYLSTTIPGIRDILFEIMTDEMEHALRFSHIYNNIKD